MKQIKIYEWQRKETPLCAGFCEMVNEALRDNPNMSLAEFAEELDAANKRATFERLIKAERRQLCEVGQ